MLKWIVGAVVIALILVLFLRRPKRQAPFETLA